MGSILMQGITCQRWYQQATPIFVYDYHDVQFAMLTAANLVLLIVGICSAFSAFRSLSSRFSASTSDPEGGHLRHVRT